MEPFRPRSTSEQLAEHLRQQIHNGIYKQSLPGAHQLVREFGVNSMAVGKALQQLENEGLLINQGQRKKRLIAQDAASPPNSLKVGMLHYEASTASRFDMLSIRQALEQAGHSVISCPKSMVEMGMSVERTARQIQSTDMDAWIVIAGSTDILQWFQEQNIPTFALHGRLTEVDLASIAVRKTPVISDLVDKLVAWGHSRIVMLTREERRKPELGFVEKCLLADLERHGIPTGRYNIPDWEDSPEGLEKVLQSLFQLTPPTAIILGDASMFHAVQLHLATMGVIAPRDVSLFCNDFEESFSWSRPKISHIYWDHRPAVRRIVKWAKNLIQGREDRKKSFIQARLSEGGTIGPAPKSSI